MIYVGDFLREFGPDSLRYFIAVAGPENQDTDFTWEEFVRRNNFELATEWGNLVNRSHLDGAPQRRRDPADRSSPSRRGPAGRLARGLRHRRRRCWRAAGSRRALGEAMRIVGAANKYLSETEPWKLGDDPDAPRHHPAHRAAGGLRREHAAHPVHAARRAAGAELLGGRGVGAQPEIRTVSEDGGPAYPVLMGDYAAEQARWASTTIEIGRPLASPSRCSASSTPSWATRPVRPGRPLSADPDLPPLPEPLPVPAIDAHTHLDACGCVDAIDVRAVLDRATAVGVAGAATVADDLASARWVVRAATWDDRVVAAVALHPTRTARVSEADHVEVERLAAQPRVVAVGETGLDYYWLRHDPRCPPPSVQQAAFRRHIDLAKRLDKPVMIHNRDAHDDVLRLLEEEGAPRQVVLHCFSGDAAMARRCADAGYLMSFAGTVTFRNAHALREAARLVPEHLLLTETDAPFLTPQPHRGRRNEPYCLPWTVRGLAELRRRRPGADRRRGPAQCRAGVPARRATGRRDRWRRRAGPAPRERGETLAVAPRPARRTIRVTRRCGRRSRLSSVGSRQPGWGTLPSAEFRSLSLSGVKPPGPCCSPLPGPTRSGHRVDLSSGRPAPAGNPARAAGACAARPGAGAVPEPRSSNRVPLPPGALLAPPAPAPAEESLTSSMPIALPPLPTSPSAARVLPPHRRRVTRAIVVAVLVALAGGAAGAVAMDKVVTINVDGSSRTVHTFAADVGGALSAAGLSVSPRDRLEPAMSTELRQR